MAIIVTGTPETRTEHSIGLANLGVFLAYGIPIATTLAGLAMHGWGAISWVGAGVWGLVAGMVMAVFMMMGQAMGITRMDIADLMGSMFAPPHSSKARGIGMGIHLVDSILLGIGWAYSSLLVGAALDWFSGLIWGLILWVLALVMLTSIGAIHPAIRKGQEEDPGTAATNFGKMTPLGSLFGHAIFGIVLGILYQTWPLN